MTVVADFRKPDFRKYSCIEDSIADHSAYLAGAMKGAVHLGFNSVHSLKDPVRFGTVIVPATPLDLHLP